MANVTVMWFGHGTAEATARPSKGINAKFTPYIHAGDGTESARMAPQLSVVGKMTRHSRAGFLPHWPANSCELFDA